MNSPRSKAYALLIITSAIWGFAGPVIRHTVEYIPPFIFLLYRFAVSAIIGLLYLSFRPVNWPTKPKDILLIFIYCFMTTTVSLGLLFAGYELTSAISGSLINALYPILTATAGVVFLHEHVTNREKIGMFIAFIGTGIVAFEPGNLNGNLLILSSILIGVALAIMAKLLLRHLGNLAVPLTHLSFIIGLITILPITSFLYSPSSIYHLISTLPTTAHIGVLYMAIISGTLAYSLWHKAQKTIEIGETAVFSYTYPLFTLPLSIFWLHESITWIVILGAIIIGTGVIIAETKPKPHHRVRH